MKFLTFSSKKLPILRNKIPHCWRNCFWWSRRNNVEKKTIFLKKTVCSQTFYRLQTGILRQFSRGCFLHFQEYTLGRKCRPKKKGLLFLFLKSDIKTPTNFQRNFSTRISILHSSCSKTPFGKKCGQSFSDHKHFLSMCRNFSAGC